MTRRSEPTDHYQGGPMATERDPVHDHIDVEGDNEDQPNVPYDGGTTPEPPVDDGAESTDETEDAPA